jgi:hypothetical protein
VKKRVDRRFRSGDSFYIVSCFCRPTHLHKQSLASEKWRENYKTVVRPTRIRGRVRFFPPNLSIFPPNFLFRAKSGCFARQMLGAMSECRTTECRMTECRTTECRILKCRTTECRMSGIPNFTMPNDRMPTTAECWIWRISACEPASVACRAAPAVFCSF